VSDTNGELTTTTPTGWAKLWHPRGVQVTIPLPSDSPAVMLARVSEFLDGGFLVTAPGLEDGEQKEQIGWVLRGEHEHEGEATPFVLLYAASDQLTWSLLKVYLNREQDVLGFEGATGMKLDQLPLYVGNDKPQRGASKKTDQFIVATPKQFGVIFKKNPKHDPNTEEGKMKPARLFVRWENQTVPPPIAAKAPMKPHELEVSKRCGIAGCFNKDDAAVVIGWLTNHQRTGDDLRADPKAAKEFCDSFDAAVTMYPGKKLLAVAKTADAESQATAMLESAPGKF
jgi:hypothetical protein